MPGTAGGQSYFGGGFSELQGLVQKFTDDKVLNDLEKTLVIFLFSLKLVQASLNWIPWGMLHGLPYHSAVFICNACQSFNSAGTFYVRNPVDSLLPDEG